MDGKRLTERGLLGALAAFAPFLPRARTHDAATRTQIFSSPADVDVVGGVAVAAVADLVTRDLVNGGRPREQGFFGGKGLPVEYDDVLFVDDLPREAHPREIVLRGVHPREVHSRKDLPREVHAREAVPQEAHPREVMEQHGADRACGELDEHPVAADAEEDRAASEVNEE